MRFLPGSHNKGIYSHDELKAKDNLLSRGQTVKGIDESKASMCRSGPDSSPFTRRIRCTHPTPTRRMTDA
jgi:hypothetical protein